jgi:iron-sulfur cluster assembly accessory protein
MVAVDVLEMTEAPVDMADVVSLTPAAVTKIQSILRERNLVNYGLRVFVAGGGCSGLQYGMALEANEREFDTVIEVSGVRLFIDPTSQMYLDGAVVDYIDNLMGGGFRIDNPNAVSSCGCGHSFRTKQQDEAQAEAAEGCGSDSCGCH